MTKLNELKTRDTDRKKVESWLNHINEHCQITRAEVMKQCEENIDARKYYVKRFTEDCSS